MRLDPQNEEAQTSPQHTALRVGDGASTQRCLGDAGRSGCLVHVFPWGVGTKGPLKAQSLMKPMFPTTNANYEARVLRHNSGIIQSGTHIRVHCLKNNLYCQSLACKFLPKLVENYGRAGSVLLLS